jgi:hypothetical protein
VKYFSQMNEMSERKQIILVAVGRMHDKVTRAKAETQ